MRPLYHPDGLPEFLVVAPVLDGSQGHFRHVMRVQYGRFGLQQPVTHGKADVQEVFGWNGRRTHM